MKKSLLALAVLGAFAGTAYAQSSVTLYGIVDVGVNYIDNVATRNDNAGNPIDGKPVWKIGTGGLQSSRWGLKGTEELSDGLKAVFQLESSFDGLFDRQAYVGLASEGGAVTLGRQSDSGADFLVPVTFNGQGSGMFSHVHNIDNTAGKFRTDYSIKYTSADYNGLMFGGLYSPGREPGNTSKNMAWSAGAGYENGPLQLGAAYLHAKDVAQDKWLRAFSFKKVDTFGAGGSFALGPTKIGLAYTNTKFDGLVAHGEDNHGVPIIILPDAGTLKADNYEIWAKHLLTPATTLGVGYTFTDGKWALNQEVHKPRYHQVNLLAAYDLSNRTAVSIVGAYNKATGKAPVNKGEITGVGAPSSTREQLAVSVGIHHTF